MHKLLYLRCGLTDFSCGSCDLQSCSHTPTTHMAPPRIKFCPGPADCLRHFGTNLNSRLPCSISMHIRPFLAYTWTKLPPFFQTEMMGDSTLAHLIYFSIFLSRPRPKHAPHTCKLLLRVGWKLCSFLWFFVWRGYTFSSPLKWNSSRLQLLLCKTTERWWVSSNGSD